MTTIHIPSFSGCISACSQDTNLPPPPPSPPHPYPPTDALRSSASIAVFSSATENLPWHETNFFVPPPHRSKHLLHEQPSFLSALLSNNSKKWPRRLGERKVSIWFVIYVLVCKNIINCISLTPRLLFHTGDGVQYHPQPTGFAAFVSFEIWAARGGKFAVRR